jgi:hypothetical protein
VDEWVSEQLTILHCCISADGVNPCSDSGLFESWPKGPVITWRYWQMLLISDNTNEFRSEFLWVLVELTVAVRLSDSSTAHSWFWVETCSSTWIFKWSSAADCNEIYCAPNLMIYHLGQKTGCTWFSCILAFVNPSTKFLDGSLNISRDVLKSRIKISGFRRGVHEFCALLGFYAA